MWGNTVAIYSVLKKKNYKAQFSTNFILKKKSTKTILEKKHKKMKKMKTILRKKMEKKHVEKVKAKFSTRSILKK